jgi:murein DD-endopeptidase MepM/ murein hydrolase activator NlpD
LPRLEEDLLKRLLWSALVGLGVAAAACGGSKQASDGGVPTITPAATLPATVTAAALVVTPVATVMPTPAVSALTGFTYPIAGGCLPKGGQLMPNAPRPYRKGIHEGVDNYGVDNCAPIWLGTPVLAAKAGRVVRADLDFRDMTRDELERNLAEPNTDAALDAFRGRQVWILHEGGVITRYAHLSGIAPGISVGTQVAGGQVIAYVGESGTPESIRNPGHEYHLHFEVRTGDGYLGQGLPPAEVRELYVKLFAPAP